MTKSILNQSSVVCGCGCWRSAAETSCLQVIFGFTRTWDSDAEREEGKTYLLPYTKGCCGGGFLLYRLLSLLLPATPRLLHNDDRDAEKQMWGGGRREEGERTNQHSQWCHRHSASPLSIQSPWALSSVQLLAEYLSKIILYNLLYFIFLLSRLHGFTCKIIKKKKKHHCVHSTQSYFLSLSQEAGRWGGEEPFEADTGKQRGKVQQVKIYR